MAEVYMPFAMAALVLVASLISIALIVAAPWVFRWFGRRYGGRVIEPDIKAIFVVLFGIMLLGELGNSHAVLPVFILGALSLEKLRRAT